MNPIQDLTPAQEKIVREICYTQLSSLRRIYNNESLSSTDMVMLLIEYEVSPEDFRNELELSIERIKRVGRTPKEIDYMNKRELSVFKHLLFNLEDKYKDSFPNAISNLWERLFILSDFKTVEEILNN